MPANHATIDLLARTLGQRLPRRTALRAAAAILLGGAAGAAASAPAQAAGRVTCRPHGAGCIRGGQCCSGNCDTRRKAPRHQRNRCACPVGTTRCGNACIDMSTSVDNCGACGVMCGSTEVCLSGACVCAGNLVSCNDSCVDLDTSASHCGGCGDACEPTEICVSGVCDCPAGAVFCNDIACVDYDTDFDNCGSCEDPCNSLTADTCVDGTCKCGSESRCNYTKGQCISGACMCGSGPACGDGVCFDDECLSCTVAQGATLCYVDVEKNVYQFTGGGSGGVSCGADTSNDACEATCGANNICFCSRAYRLTAGSTMERSYNCVAFPVANQVI